MSEIFKGLEEAVTKPKKDELQSLKERADLMGISYPANVTLATLKKKVNEQIEAKEEGEVSEDELTLNTDGSVSKKTSPKDEEYPDIGKSTETKEVSEQKEKEVETKEVEKKASPKRKLTFREQLYRENMKLIRVRIHQLDPKKKDLPGEVFTVCNEYLGTLRKYVPYGEQQGDKGYMMEHWLYTMLKDRKFLNIRTLKRNGIEYTDSRWSPEFHLEVLPNPTPAELAQLRANQHGLGSLEG